MGKRSTFERKDRDFYATVDPLAVQVIAPYVNGTKFIEPCGGNGLLLHQLEDYNAICVGAYDIEPGHPRVINLNCLDITEEMSVDADVFITNPPFSWPMLQPILEKLPMIKPTWLLLPADNMHNKRMGPFMENCEMVLSVGRLYWMDNKVKGVDNYCWYLFTDSPKKTIFKGRL